MESANNTAIQRRWRPLSTHEGALVAGTTYQYLSIRLPDCRPMIRSISIDEAAVLERTLQVGSVRALSPKVMESVGKLPVTAPCKCVCATVWFGPDRDAASGTKFAEA